MRRTSMESMPHLRDAFSIQPDVGVASPCFAGFPRQTRRRQVGVDRWSGQRKQNVRFTRRPRRAKGDSQPSMMLYRRRTGRAQVSVKRASSGSPETRNVTYMHDLRTPVRTSVSLSHGAYSALTVRRRGTTGRHSHGCSPSRTPSRGSGSARGCRASPPRTRS